MLDYAAPRFSRARHRTLLTLAVLLVAAAPLPAQPVARGEADWLDGQTKALRGDASGALAAYTRALAIAREERDAGLASAARLGMAEVYDVWHRCADSADVAYKEAVQLAEEFDLLAADAYVRWLAANDRSQEASDLLTRMYAGLDVPRTIKRETITFLLGQAAVQRGRGNGPAALASLRTARDVADRLAAGDVTDAVTQGDTAGVAPPSTINPLTYWVMHDIAQLRLDPKAGGARNAEAGATMQQELDAASTVSDAGSVPRFTVARLAERVARARRLCGSGECETPPPPSESKC